MVRDIIGNYAFEVLMLRFLVLLSMLETHAMASVVMNNHRGEDGIARERCALLRNSLPFL